MKILRDLCISLSLIAVTVVTLCLLTSGCKMKPVTIENVEDFGNHVKYFKDTRGNCFAFISANKSGETGPSAIGFSIVPRENCEKNWKCK